MNKKTLLLSAALLLILALACRKSPMDIIDDVNLRIGTEVFEYTVQGKIVDDADWSTSLTNAKVFVEGEYAEYAYDGSSGTKEISVSSDGTFSIGIDPKIAPMPGHPIVLSILIMADGYVAQSEDVVIRKDENFKQYRAALINYNNPPDYLELEVEHMNLSAGKVNEDFFFKGKNSATDSVYYDDGLTTVVLAKNTRFWYLNYQKTGTALRPKSYTTVVDTVIVNGERATIKRDVVNSYDTVDVFGYVKTYYTGSDLEIQAYYAKGNDIDFRIHHNRSWDNEEFEVLTDPEKVPHKNLLFTSIVRKRLYRLAFVGADSEGKPIDLRPESEPGQLQWFTSYVLDENAINPSTGGVIKEGDSIEVGIDYESKKTIREVVLKAANGQLRAETQDINVGYYERALHSLDVNYTWNVQENAEVPDKENLYAWAEVELNNNYSFWNYISGNYSHAYKTNFTISSKVPMSASGFIDAYYCGTRITDQQNLPNNGTYNVFNYGQLFNIFPNKVSFDVSLICPDSTVIIKPSYFGSFYGDNNYYYVHMQNGKWATRGVKLGQPYRLYGSANGSSIDTTLTITENHYDLGFLLKGANGLCK